MYSFIYISTNRKCHRSCNGWLQTDPSSDPRWDKGWCAESVPEVIPTLAACHKIAPYCQHESPAHRGPVSCLPNSWALGMSIFPITPSCNCTDSNMHKMVHATDVLQRPSVFKSCRQHQARRLCERANLGTKNETVGKTNLDLRVLQCCSSGELLLVYNTYT